MYVHLYKQTQNNTKKNNKINCKLNTIAQKFLLALLLTQWKQTEVNGHKNAAYTVSKPFTFYFPLARFLSEFLQWCCLSFWCRFRRLFHSRFRFFHASNKERIPTFPFFLFCSVKIKNKISPIIGSKFIYFKPNREWLILMTGKKLNALYSDASRKRVSHFQE